MKDMILRVQRETYRDIKLIIIMLTDHIAYDPLLASIITEKM